VVVLDYSGTRRLRTWILLRNNKLEYEETLVRGETKRLTIVVLSMGTFSSSVNFAFR
jgi:hypothetical protein